MAAGSYLFLVTWSEPLPTFWHPIARRAEKKTRRRAEAILQSWWDDDAIGGRIRAAHREQLLHGEAFVETDREG